MFFVSFNSQTKQMHIVYFSQVIPEDVHVDARLFAVRSAKHVCISIFNFRIKKLHFIYC